MRLVVDANELFAGIIAKGKKLYFALALKLDCPIWAQEKAFKKKQSRIRVFHTTELKPLLSKTSP